MSKEKYEGAVKMLDKIDNSVICKEGRDALKPLLAQLCGYELEDSVALGSVVRHQDIDYLIIGLPVNKGNSHLGYALAKRDKLFFHQGALRSNTTNLTFENNYYFLCFDLKVLASSLEEYYSKKSRGEL